MNKKAKNNTLQIRNSTAEFLIFAYQSKGDGVEVRVQDGTIWLSQKSMGLLFDTSTDNIGLHFKNIFAESELNEVSTTEDFSVVQQEGNREVSRMVKHYNLDAIIAVGYRVNSKRATAFRQWATVVLRDFALRGYVIVVSWEKSPKGKIVKTDVSIAKNYLTESELGSLGRIVNGYLDFAEEYAKQQIPLTMNDWAKHLDLILQANGRDLLQNTGIITAALAKQHAENEFEKYRPIQDRLFESDFDRVIKETSKNIIGNGDDM